VKKPSNGSTHHLEEEEKVEEADDHLESEGLELSPRRKPTSGEGEEANLQSPSEKVSLLQHTSP
jgi:hypothetical protein